MSCLGLKTHVSFAVACAYSTIEKKDFFDYV